MLYSKDGSIPKPETDGTEGWVEVPDPPIPPDPQTSSAGIVSYNGTSYDYTNATAGAAMYSGKI